MLATTRLLRNALAERAWSRHGFPLRLNKIAYQTLAGC